MRGVLLVLAVAGCQVVFPLEADNTAQPVQQLVKSRKEGDPGPIIVMPNPTTAGNLLVAIVLVRSTSEHVNMIVDSAANTWSPALVGNNYGDMTESPVRIEIWYAPHAASIIQATLLAADRPMAMLFTELDLTSTNVTLGSAKPMGDVLSDTAATGEIQIAQRSLVIGAVSYNVASSATLASPDYSELVPFAADDVHAASAIQIIDAGAVSAEWSLGDPTAHWNAGIVGLSL